MSLALYRKYRPKSLSDLLGQENVITVLKNAAIHDRIGHAYLFYGTRGTGKTTVARLLAKLINCETRQTDKKFHDKGEPCNTCRPCTEIDSGRGIDVVEIDAASNTGVDEIRNLKEGIRLSPSSYKYKVYILDEAHMLSKSAFNALLKTLEEPPAHAIFILATTEYDKLPSTIVSRTQRLHFKKLTVEQVVEKLEGITKKEKLKVDADALELIASLAEGSLRDGESLLDQLSALTEHIDIATVEKTLGQVGFGRTSKAADLILKADMKGILALISEMNESGYNVTDLNKELIHYFRRALTLHVSPELETQFAKEFTKKELADLKAHAALINPQKHTPLIRALIEAYSQMRYSPFASVPLEVAIIEYLK